MKVELLLFLEDLEVDGDELAIGGFDEVSGVGVCDMHAGIGLEPAVMAVLLVALVVKPRGNFFQGGCGAVNVGLGDDECWAFFSENDSVKPYIITEVAVAGGDVVEVGDGTL